MPSAERGGHGSRAGEDEARVEVEIYVDATMPTVWSAIADHEHRRRWWSYLELEACPGGPLLERWRDGEGRTRTTAGEVLEADPPTRLRCSWRDDDWPDATDVELELRSFRDATRVHLRHSGWQRLGEAGAALCEEHAEGWRMHLADLKEYVERARFRHGA